MGYVDSQDKGRSLTYWVPIVLPILIGLLLPLLDLKSNLQESSTLKFAVELEGGEPKEALQELLEKAKKLASTGSLTERKVQELNDQLSVALKEISILPFQVLEGLRLTKSLFIID